MAKGQSNEPQEWVEGQAAAREARQRVADQIAQLLVKRDMTGDEAVFVRRINELGAAVREGDHAVIRAAVMEATLAGGAWLVALDLKQRW